MVYYWFLTRTNQSVSGEMCARCSGDDQSFTKNFALYGVGSDSLGGLPDLLIWQTSLIVVSKSLEGAG